MGGVKQKGPLVAAARAAPAHHRSGRSTRVVRGRVGGRVPLVTRTSLSVVSSMMTLMTVSMVLRAARPLAPLLAGHICDVVVVVVVVVDVVQS